MSKYSNNGYYCKYQLEMLLYNNSGQLYTIADVSDTHRDVIVTHL